MLRRFVCMALEELPVEVLECDRVTSAIQILAAEPVQLIMTDLMLPGPSGVDFLQYLQAYPALRSQARIVVFSAGITATSKLQLAPLQVWRTLEKPASIAVLEQCVREALADKLPPAAAVASKPRGVQFAAIDPYFGGDAELYHLYRATCLTQFPYDIATGDKAIATHDLPALRRVAHNLKTVLLTINLSGMADQARQLEQACQAGPPNTAQRNWHALRATLAALVTPGGAPIPPVQRRQ